MDFFYRNFFAVATALHAGLKNVPIYGFTKSELLCFEQDRNRASLQHGIATWGFEKVCHVIFRRSVL